ncbi:AarF/ABC1/UbiB kinase family protein [Candidatus Pacearchaeota archaeon]|nr:AarF/ABC1/UbiB kinase family protein [Candidatus Pacearchaeota archaeon]
MVFNKFNGLTDIKRLKRIISVLTGQGFGYFIEELDLKHYIPFSERTKLKKAKREKKSAPLRLRLAFEELGPTFVKFGQLMSTRPDLLPEEFITELSKLQDKVPSFSHRQVKEQIEKELGKPINHIFSYFSKDPIASASIGQVHKAKLKNGKKVAVKIQRPNIEKTIDEDLDILTFFANLIDKYIPSLEIYNPKGLVEEFEKTIKKELNYEIEGNNILRFHQNFKDSETVVVPKIYQDYSTKKILTMSFIEGTKISELWRIKGKWLNKKTIAQNGIDAFFKQILIYGFFHADPHPGNIFVLKNNVLAFLDFGMMGHVDKELMQKLTNLFTATINKDIDKIVEEFVNLSLVGGEIDAESFKSDVSDIVDEYYGISLKKIEMGKMINQIISIGGKYHIIFPANFVLLIKALTTIESIGAKLDPDFNIMEASKPFIKKIAKRKMSPKYIFNNFVENLSKTKDSMIVLPQKINAILNELQSGKLKTKIEQEEFEELESRIDKSSSKISISLITAAIIISSTVILQIDKGPSLFGISIFALIGFSIAAFLIVWLIFSIIISKIFG